MLAQWITDGVGAGLRIAFATLTLLLVLGGVLGLLSAIIKAVGKGEDE